jgi:hypothetical protein
MKTNMNLLGAMLVMGLFIGSTEVQAQGRGNQGKGKAKGHEKHQHKYDRDGHYHYYSDRHWRGPTHDRHGRRYVYHRPPHWAPAHGYRNQVRYVYYRDYNVYYDCYRGVYITLSGRNWVYSQHIPVHMRRAPRDRMVYVELDYFEDDLPYYVERRRPGGYVSIHASF